MTAGEIINEAQSLTRITSGPTAAQQLAWLNRIQRSYARKNDWPELKTLAATVVTVANQAYVALPVAFERFVGKTVLYNPTAITGGYVDGYPIPLLPAGSPQLETMVAAWRPTGSGQYPIAASLGGSSGAYRLYLYPFPTLSSTTIVFDYFRAPAALTTTASVPELQHLCDTFTLAMAAEFVSYSDNSEAEAKFRAKERREYNHALRNLLTT